VHEAPESLALPPKMASALGLKGSTSQHVSNKNDPTPEAKHDAIRSKHEHKKRNKNTCFISPSRKSRDIFQRGG